MTELYRKVALIGMGLIGSSLARGIRERALAHSIHGVARSRQTIEVARELGLVDRMGASLEEAVEGADLVMLCTPVRTFGKIARSIAPHLASGATLTDVGSVKRYVIGAVSPHVPEHVQFVPAHPLAGTERSGPRAGFADLFVNRWCLITPLEDADSAAVDKLAEFWRRLGSQVDFMDAGHHDVVLAVTSHVPHLIAYSMVGTADHLHRVSNSEVIQYSAAGFRDFTRIAASDPTMWHDVFLSNREATLDILGRFTEELFALQRAIRIGEGDTLLEYFQRTRAIRRGIVEAGQDTDRPDFGRAVRR
ncbi:MAG: prephenate/arogenate dehydrogenase family protein [Rhodobacteraceae bacterium]|nr:prephenate/arogenate dehydrogenase family protein [Paracoccaceae bacterium]